MKMWKVNVSDEAMYFGIEADTAEQAKSIAWDWFQEREPCFNVQEMKDEDDDEELE